MLTPIGGALKAVVLNTVVAIGRADRPREKIKCRTNENNKQFNWIWGGTGFSAATSSTETTMCTLSPH